MLMVNESITSWPLKVYDIYLYLIYHDWDRLECFSWTISIYCHGATFFLFNISTSFQSYTIIFSFHHSQYNCSFSAEKNDAFFFVTCALSFTAFNNYAPALKNLTCCAGNEIHVIFCFFPLKSEHWSSCCDWIIKFKIIKTSTLNKWEMNQSGYFDRKECNQHSSLCVSAKNNKWKIFLFFKKEKQGMYNYVIELKKMNFKKCL